MSTPLKSLSALPSPRLLSPLSPNTPKLLPVPRKFDNFVKSKHLLRNEESVTYAVKRLNFSQHSSPKCQNEPVEVKITECDVTDREPLVSRDILINTPNKRSIFEEGIGRGQGHNILGTGSFGKVVRGIYKGETVAVKIVKNMLILNERNALNLSHRNIVRTLDIIQNQNGNFSLIIMEYFPTSKQLQTILEDSDFDMASKKIQFALDVTTGLHFLHKNDILHLDLKPQNILVAENICKICDFGNSVLVTDMGNFIHKGTVVYTAPELLQGKMPTEKCDVYSLGILLWQLQSRQPPYLEMDNVESVIYKVVKCNCRPEDPTARDDYSKLYQVCWATDPNDRPGACDIVLTLKLLS